MLIQSNKNNQIEVVSLLLYTSSSVVSATNFSSGVLTRLLQLEKEATRLSKNNSQLFKIVKVASNSTS
jgi:hypothetical protein